ncbi:MAG TPA: NYN domain-containing protein [Candidatus Paceibacterota bacterium]
MSVIKHKEQRVGIFIDAQNLYHSAKNLYGARVNFGQIVKDAVAGRALIRAVAYVITTESGDEKAFFEALGKMGIETKTKDLQIFSSGSKKADWDVGLAVDAIKMAPKLDTVIIVSGDGDFIPLVEYLKINEGCQVEAIAFGKSASGKLKEAADDFIDLDHNPRKYLLGHFGGGRKPRHHASERRQATQEKVAEVTEVE